MNNIRHLLILSFATATLLLSLPFFYEGRVVAQGDDTQPGDVRATDRMAGQGDGALIGRLNLTPDQIRKIREIRQQSSEEMRATRQRMVRAQFELDEAIYADSVDEAAIEAHARDLAAAQAGVARLRAFTELRIRRVLTPEQLNLLREIRHEARERGLDGTRDLRRNPSAFQERRRRKASGPDQNSVSPGTSNKPQGLTVAPVRKP